MLPTSFAPLSLTTPTTPTQGSGGNNNQSNRRRLVHLTVLADDNAVEAEVVQDHAALRISMGQRSSMDHHLVDNRQMHHDLEEVHLTPPPLPHPHPSPRPIRLNFDPLESSSSSSSGGEEEREDVREVASMKNPDEIHQDVSGQAMSHNSMLPTSTTTAQSLPLSD